MPDVTAEFGTLTARGVFQVADRKFLDRRMLEGEKHLWRTGQLFTPEEDVSESTAFCCAMLTRLRLKSTDPEVTALWLMEMLTQEEIGLLSVYIHSGAKGVQKVLSSMEQTSTSPPPDEPTPS